MPIRSNQAAIERAFIDAGVIFLDADMKGGGGLRLTKSTEALRDILLIGGLKESRDMRMQRARKRIAQFCEDAAAFYGDGKDNRDRVRSDRGKLRDRVDQEIELRLRLRWDDQATRFLEPVTDLLHENR